MSGVFQNIDLQNIDLNILEDARHSFVLYICKYFVEGR